LIFILQKINK
jgi:hypothetical protein